MRHRLIHRIKQGIFVFLSVLAVAVGVGFFSLTRIEGVSSTGFSAERVAADIQIISQEPHSIQQPQARASVRTYLANRLQGLGAVPAIYSYDSIPDKWGGHIDIANVYAVFDPLDGPAQSYIMMVAHLDSRFATQVLDDTVLSYGAADDGYGLGVILESVSGALRYRNQWKQGIKVLFTDSEECDLDGMRQAFTRDRALFDKVGLVCNLEARGVKGPAYLFETSPGNSRVIDLYKKAKAPYTYSLTSVIYELLPNFTDFTVVKDSLPGVNFSVIDNLRYYHTDKDNYQNISLRSLQHYGDQIAPMLHTFLVDETYSDDTYFVSKEHKVFFSVPALGLFVFTKDAYLLWNAIAFALFCLSFVLAVRRMGLSPRAMLKKALWLFMVALLILGIGEGIAYLAAKYTGERFSFTDIRYVTYDYVFIIGYLVLIVIGIFLYIRRHYRSSRRFIVEIFFGTQCLVFVLSLVLYITLGENFFLLIPLLLASASFVISQINYGGIAFLVAAIGILLLGSSFYYCLIIAVTIGSLGVMAMLAFLTLLYTITLGIMWQQEKKPIKLKY